MDLLSLAHWSCSWLDSNIFQEDGRGRGGGGGGLGFRIGEGMGMGMGMEREKEHTVINCKMHSSILYNDADPRKSVFAQQLYLQIPNFVTDVLKI